MEAMGGPIDSFSKEDSQWMQKTTRCVFFKVSYSTGSVRRTNSKNMI
jgi:hypothetical protein